MTTQTETKTAAEITQEIRALLNSIPPEHRPKIGKILQLTFDLIETAPEAVAAAEAQS